MNLKITQNGKSGAFRPAFCRQETCGAREDDAFCPRCGADIGAYLAAIGAGPAVDAPAPLIAQQPTPAAETVAEAATHELPGLVLPPRVRAYRGDDGDGVRQPGFGAAPPDHDAGASVPVDEEEPPSDRWARWALAGGAVVGAGGGVALALALGLV